MNKQKDQVERLSKEIERLRRVLASVHASTDLKTARRRAYEGRYEQAR